MKNTPEEAAVLTAKADECLNLAKDQHHLAERLHDVAARQLDNAAQQMDNAAKQQKIAAQQHVDADSLDGKAKKLAVVGNSLEAKAVEIVGETQVVKRGK